MNLSLSNDMFNVKIIWSGGISCNNICIEVIICVALFRVFWGGSVAVLAAVRPASRSGLSPERSSSPGESPDEAGGSGLSGEEGS